MNSLGIYFGPKDISIVETKHKKLVTNILIPQSTILAGGLEDRESGEAKIIEIIALFKDNLRRNKINTKEADICLSGKDLIIRSFEMPLMPKEELETAINFEAKKYIPFRIEEMFAAWQIEQDKLNHTNIVYFMGIKKDVLDRYLAMLKQLDIRIKSVQYSAFSLLKAMKLVGVNDKGVIGVIGVDFQGQDEANFVVLENGFPLFSRDISLSGAPGELETGMEAEAGINSEKFKTEIRVSLDYYHRKFPTKHIKKVVLISNPDARPDLESYLKETGFAVNYLDFAKYRYIGKQAGVFSLSLLKAYGVSLSGAINTRLKVDLLASKQKIRAFKEKGPAIGLSSILQGLKLDYRPVVLGILICAAVYGFGIYRKAPVLKEIDLIKGKRITIASVKPTDTYEQLTKLSSKYKNKLEVINNLIRKQLYVTDTLSVIPAVIPEGIWLTRFSFNKKDDQANLVMDGAVVLESRDKEFEAVNKFVLNLQKNPEFSKYFYSVNILSIDQRQAGDSSMSSFSISCKGYPRKE